MTTSETIKVGNNIEIKFEEKVSNTRSFLKRYWLQGEFYFNKEKRVATVTDVKFISANLLVVAHREAAKLYLVKLSGSDYEIIHEKPLRTRLLPSRKRFFYPDLMAVKDHLIYMTEYSNRCAVLKLDGDKFIFKNVINVGRHSYHGCFIENNSLLLGSVRDGIVQILDTKTQRTSQIKFNPESAPINERNLRIKTIGKQEDYLIMGMDRPIGNLGHPNDGGDSWVGLFERNNDHLKCVSLIKFENAQLDGHATNNGLHFFTTHDGNRKKGVIQIIKEENGELKVVHSVVCESFPHGIDILDGKVAYTSYKQCSVNIFDLDYMFQTDHLD
ncbi:hypothetical protein [Flagellimonas marinaquae]